MVNASDWWLCKLINAKCSSLCFRRPSLFLASPVLSASQTPSGSVLRGVLGCSLSPHRSKRQCQPQPTRNLVVKVVSGYCAKVSGSVRLNLAQPLKCQTLGLRFSLCPPIHSVDRVFTYLFSKKSTQCSNQQTNSTVIFNV